jgi:hypothetical protein
MYTQGQKPKKAGQVLFSTVNFWSGIMPLDLQKYTNFHVSGFKNFEFWISIPHYKLIEKL